MERLSGNNIYWLTSARKPFETKGFRAFYVLVKMPLQHFCNTQCENYKKEWLQVAIKLSSEEVNYLNGVVSSRNIVAGHQAAAIWQSTGRRFVILLSIFSTYKYFLEIAAHFMPLIR